MKTEQELGLEFIKHHGVKGMHWGVRKEQVKSGGRKLSTLGKDFKFETQSSKSDVKFEIAKNASKKLEADLPRIKAKHGSVSDLRNRIKNPLGKEARAYRKDVRDTYIKHLEASANEMKNASGNRQRTLGRSLGLAVDFKTFEVVEVRVPNSSKYFWKVSTKPIQHAAEPFLTVEPIFDADGFIIAVKPVPDSLQQAEDFIDNLLTHHGVKGMHWGVRREEMRTSSAIKRGAKEVKRREHRAPAPVRVTDSIGSSGVTKTKLKAVGGEDHPAHEDAIKVAGARQQLKKSGIHTLSNDELRDMAVRMNLEAQVTSLNSKRKRSIGQGFVDAHLARAQKDPFGTVVKAHKISKRASDAKFAWKVRPATV